jgi:hypothetical protein
MCKNNEYSIIYSSITSIYCGYAFFRKIMVSQINDDHFIICVIAVVLHSKNDNEIAFILSSTHLYTLYTVYYTYIKTKIYFILFLLMHLYSQVIDIFRLLLNIDLEYSFTCALT